ncbi:hypothetical protein NDU88_003242, partial [Pleurodeles waltl]
LCLRRDNRTALITSLTIYWKELSNGTPPTEKSFPESAPLSYPSDAVSVSAVSVSDPMSELSSITR